MKIDASQKVNAMTMLKETEERRVTTSRQVDWHNVELTRLVAYIVQTHHHYTRQELVRLADLVTKARIRHEQNHPELALVESLLLELSQDLSLHMFKEEKVLFPYIIIMEDALNNDEPLPPAPFESVSNPIKMMMTEHDAATQLLEKLREVTSGYDIPADACASYISLYQGLEELEADLHEHMHLENDILFVRAVETEVMHQPGIAIC